MTAMRFWNSLFILVVVVLGLQNSWSQPARDHQLVLIYAGRMPGLGEAIGKAVNESGYEALVVDEDTFRSLLTLPQTICVVIAAFNPSDFVFLREVTPAIERYLVEGGSLVGIGSVCSYDDMGDLATQVFPIRGNASMMGKRIGDRFGSKLVLSEPVKGISDRLPPSFVVTQSRFVICQGSSGPLDPVNPGGEIKVVYREESTGAPLVVAYERDGGGRTVSMPGLYTVDVERLPFYWGKLVKEPEFTELVRGSVSWAADGSKRYQTLSASLQGILEKRADEIAQVKAAGEKLRKGEKLRRLGVLLVLWTLVILLDGYLSLRFIGPRLRSPR